ncbi:MAG: PIN domain-containing protein [Planctomycetaceae bacterium]
MNAVDTNVLIYAHDPRDPAKHSTADALIQSVPDGVLLWQVACEYLAASRKLAPLGYDSQAAWQDIIDLRTVWTSILPSWSVHDASRDLMDRFSLSFWDALIIAACLDADVERLYSEDFDAYSDVDGLEIVNPFSGQS